MDDYATLDTGTMQTREGVTSEAKNMADIGGVMEVLSLVDLDLAYTSEKLGNLDMLLMHLMAFENDLEAMADEHGNSSEELIEKVLNFDFISGILEFEVKDLGNYIGSLQPVIDDARLKISSCGNLRELFISMEVKLNDSEDSLKKLKEEVLDIKMQSAKLQRTLFAFKHKDGKYDRSKSFTENGQVVELNGKPKTHSIEQHRHVLRMLEKSLARELDLEKKLSKLKQNEEDLKRKQSLTAQVAFCMEEAAEVVWGRFLEAENSAEVLMGTSKELVGRLQIVQFHVNGSIQREDDAKSKLQASLEQMKGKETALQKLESRAAELIADNAEVNSLRGKVQLLEEKLKETEFHLTNANSRDEANQEHLEEMDNVIESLRENIDIAESRAESAEAKVTQLTDTNMELTEEMGFLKNNNDSNRKKVSVLEKQLRESEIQLQQARASFEACQEQQNMLYSAIWDMETLIEELKSKVSKAEIKTDHAEEQCVILTECNLELEKELSFTRNRVESLEASLQQANEAKIASAKDVDLRTKLIMDMVMQLAIERERINKQLNYFSVEKKLLMEKLQHTKMNNARYMDADDNQKASSFNHDRDEASEEAAIEQSAISFQADESSKDAPFEAEEASTANANGDTNAAPERLEGKRNRECVSMAILVLLLSAVATYLLREQNAVPL